MKHSPQVLRRSPHRSELPRDMHATVDQYRDVIGFRRLQARLKARRKEAARQYTFRPDYDDDGKADPHLPSFATTKFGRRRRHRESIKLIRGLVEKRDKMVAALEND